MGKDILISTGDFSGNRMAERVISELSRKGKYRFYGIAGKETKLKGVEIIQEREGAGVVGFTEALPKILNERKNFRKVKDFIDNHKIDAVILFDNPGFNLPLSKLFYNTGIRVFYITPPQVWAWGEWRIKYLRKYIYLNLVSLPFEDEYYKKRGVDAVYIGHPAGLLRPEKKQNIFVFMPGSRDNEIRYLIPRLANVLLEWTKQRNLVPVVAFPDAPDSKIWLDFARKYLPEAEFCIGETHKMLSRTRIGVICSGTATLEAVFSSTPAVVVYRLSPLSYFIGKSLLKTKYISLANIIAGKEVQREVLQYQLNKRNIHKALDFTLKNQSEILREYKSIKQKFGEENAYEKASEILASLI